MKKHRNWIILTLFGILLYAVIIMALVDNYQAKQDTYLATEMDAFSSKITTTLSTYEKFSNYVFNKVINQNYMMHLMNKANLGSESDKKQLRKELYDYFRMIMN